MTVDTKTRPISAYAETRAAGDSEFTRRFVATTSGVKRDGLDIVLEGMSTENFMRNPVFLWVHDYFGERMPIGRVTKIAMQKKRMIITVLFDKDDEFAVEVLRKYDARMLSAVSVGWETLEFDRDTMQVLESDLLDVSAVPVPGDPDALMMRTKSMLRSLGQELLDKFPEDDEDARCGTDDCEWSLAKPVHTCGRNAQGFFDGGVIPGPINIMIEGEVVGDPDQLAALIREDLAKRDKISGEQQETIDTQEGKRMAVTRVERVVAALDEFRSALSDWIDSATDGETDESMAALLTAFDGDKNTEGEED